MNFGSFIEDNSLLETVEALSGVNAASEKPIATDDISIIPLQNSILFPNTTIPMQITQPKSILLLRSLKSRTPVFFVLQVEGKEKLHEAGTVGVIIRAVESSGNFNIIVQGRERAKVEKITQVDPFYKGRISLLNETKIPSDRVKGYEHAVKDMARQIIDLSPVMPKDAITVVEGIKNLRTLIHIAALNLNISPIEKLDILKEDNLALRTELILEHLSNELETLKFSTKIQTKVRSDIDKAQRDYFLRQQLKVIQEELSSDEGDDDISKMRSRLESLDIKEEHKNVIRREVNKLSRASSLLPEHATIYNYVDFCLSLPWGKLTKDEADIEKAKSILDKEHYGIKEAKERILEFIAVLQLRKELKGPILCFVGPPGVGKTSLGLSIAKALGRKSARVSLGGVNDQAELRGHRRTYIGAMAGRILQNILRAGSMNPVFILDEVDKLGAGYHGDPASALLEILDPMQNHSFSDHYLEIPFDLSKTLFIATANYSDAIPAPLLDRMEMISIDGYTNSEKIKIAQRHLVTRQLKENGLSRKQLKFSKSALLKIIEGYTRESGVRSLERRLGKICRSAIKHIVSSKNMKLPILIKPEVLVDYLGYEKNRVDEYTKKLRYGVALGLAWTPVGGDVLYIETLLIDGTGKIVMTGKLGDVMKESVSAAVSYLKSNAGHFEIPHHAFEIKDIHVHIPQGAIPKDGPSAGITILASLASAFTRRSLLPRLAMTGEVTLRGELLAVGGLKEKLLAAKRFGITTVFIPKQNQNNVKEVFDSYEKDFQGPKLIYFDNMLKVLDAALLAPSKNAPPIKSYYLIDKKKDGVDDVMKEQVTSS